MVNLDLDFEDEEEDNSIPYNPKNLPVGWDGKVGVCVWTELDKQ